MTQARERGEGRSPVFPSPDATALSRAEFKNLFGVVPVVIVGDVDRLIIVLFA